MCGVTLFSIIFEVASGFFLCVYSKKIVLADTKKTLSIFARRLSS